MAKLLLVKPSFVRRGELKRICHSKITFQCFQPLVVYRVDALVVYESTFLQSLYCMKQPYCMKQSYCSGLWNLHLWERRADLLLHVASQSGHTSTQSEGRCLTLMCSLTLNFLRLKQPQNRQLNTLVPSSSTRFSIFRDRSSEITTVIQH